MLLEKILQQGPGADGLHLRETAYGEAGKSQLLREVLGMANAQVSGSRYILFGVSFTEEGGLEFAKLPSQALEELQSYAEIITRYVEPELQAEAFVGDVQGNMVGALEIKSCGNPPYLLKVDANKEMGTWFMLG